MILFVEDSWRISEFDNPNANISLETTILWPLTIFENLYPLETDKMIINEINDSFNQTKLRIDFN